jgi:hypothetical protein
MGTRWQLLLAALLTSCALQSVEVQLWERNISCLAATCVYSSPPEEMFRVNKVTFNICGIYCVAGGTYRWPQSWMHLLTMGSRGAG